jgi:hypothetical protein
MAGRATAKALATDGFFATIEFAEIEFAEPPPLVFSRHAGYRNLRWTSVYQN